MFSQIIISKISNSKNWNYLILFEILGHLPYATLFSDFLYKSIYCRYSSELPQLVEAIQMSTHNICFYKVVDKSTLAVK